VETVLVEEGQVGCGEEPEFHAGISVVDDEMGPMSADRKGNQHPRWGIGRCWRRTLMPSMVCVTSLSYPMCFLILFQA
jgi:hypothetical protein